MNNFELKSLNVTTQERNGWLFRTSIANRTNVMILTFNVSVPNSFMIRYFVDPELAKCWVDEVAEGKHLD